MLLRCFFFKVFSTCATKPDDDENLGNELKLNTWCAALRHIVYNEVIVLFNNFIENLLKETQSK